MAIPSERQWNSARLSSDLPGRKSIPKDKERLLLYDVSYYNMQISELVSEVADGPFVLNVSADSSMIIVDKLVDGLTYTFSVCVRYIYMTHSIIYAITLQVRGLTLAGFGEKSTTVKAILPDDILTTVPSIIIAGEKKYIYAVTDA